MIFMFIFWDYLKNSENHLTSAIILLLIAINIIVGYFGSTKILINKNYSILNNEWTIAEWITAFLGALSIIYVLSLSELYSYAPKREDNISNDERILKNGGWKCNKCNKVNPEYITTCDCGVSKFNNYTEEPNVVIKTNTLSDK